MHGLGDFDNQLHDTLMTLLVERPQGVGWLTARARKALRDARVGEECVVRVVDTSTVLLGLPDGTVSRLINVLDGQVLTHRVRSRPGHRSDLWTNLALQPLLVCAMFGPIPLATGGEVRAAEFGHPALVGPAGWLADAGAGSLLAFRMTDRQLTVDAMPQGITTPSEHEQGVRAALARHYRLETWWKDDPIEDRPAQLNRALGHALIEAPDLLSEPVSPLNELLYDVLQQERQDHVFRDTAAWEAGECVSFYVTGMPEGLHSELAGRARKYGMSFDQYVVAVLGHAAWRTPFADDLGPWSGA